MVVVYEGLHTYGGLAGRDMEAMARGIVESVDDDHIRTRIGQVEYLGQKLIDWGIPVVHPIGGHAVFLDAKAFYPQLAAGPVPRPDAWRPNCTSIRASAAWSAASSRPAATRPPATTTIPKLELVRLTIPRRVYTQAHMDVVAESVAAVYDDRAKARGLQNALRAEVPAVLPGPLRAALTGRIAVQCTSHPPCAVYIVHRQQACQARDKQAPPRRARARPRCPRV